MLKDWQLSERGCLDDFEDYGPERVIFSGSLPHEKLDIKLTKGKLEGWRISNKFTTKKSASFTLEDLTKDFKQGALNGAKVFRRIEFSNGKKYILLEQDLFKELLYEEKEGSRDS